MESFAQYKTIVYDIIGAAMEVYNELGFGLREPVYQEALMMELQTRNIVCEREKMVNIYYKGQKMDQFYKLDMLVEDTIIIETKSVYELAADNRSQLFNYMRLTGKPVGILINFGNYLNIQGERYVLSDGFCYRVDKNMNFLE